MAQDKGYIYDLTKTAKSTDIVYIIFSNGIRGTITVGDLIASLNVATKDDITDVSSQIIDYSDKPSKIVTASETISTNYGVYYVDASAGPITLTFPSTTVDRDRWKFKFIDATNIITFSGGATKTVDGQASISGHYKQYQAVEAESDGNNYFLF